jgi:hypothetical protein
MAIAALTIAGVVTAGSLATPHAKASLPICPPPSKVLNGVYHPERLVVKDRCKKGAGTVIDIKHESGEGGDGDLHIQLKLDPFYASLKNAVNDSKQHGNLVVEFMPRDGGHLPRPHVGEHLVLVGAWVLDTQHGWLELHPVWKVTLNGHSYRSGPQNGGSPPCSACHSGARATSPRCRAHEEDGITSSATRTLEGGGQSRERLTVVGVTFSISSGTDRR